MSKVMKCYGQYVANDPCYPLCTNPSTGECDYSSVFGGSSAGGPTDNYTTTWGDAVAGNTSTQTHISVLDPYQSQNPKDFGFNGESTGCPFLDERYNNAYGTPSIDVDGKTYTYQPTFAFKRNDFFNSPEQGFVDDNYDCQRWPQLCRNRENPMGDLRVSAMRLVDGQIGFTG